MWVARFKYVLIFWTLFWTILYTRIRTCSTRGASQSQNQVRATINKPVSLKCTLPIPLVNLTHLAWNWCSTEDQCRADWDKHRIAHITDKTEVHLDYPERYKLDSNGTLTIKEVLPEDDNKVFICLGTVALIDVEENTTVLKIIREKPKINTRNPSENEIIEGMPLMIECKIHAGYPYPLMTLRHNQDIVLKGTNMDPMYIRQNASKMDNGNYTCTAENPLGSDSFTIKVNVIARAGTDKTADHVNTEESLSCFLWKVLFGVVFGLSGAGLLFTKRNKVLGWIKLCHPSTSQNGGDSLDLLTAPNIKGDNSHSGDTIESPGESEGTNYSGWGQDVISPRDLE